MGNYKVYEHLFPNGKRYIGRICNGTYRKDTDIACGFRWKLGNVGNYRVPNSKHYKGR